MMGTYSPMKTLLTALLVVAFGWWSGYMVLQGWHHFQPGTGRVNNVDRQKAVTLEAFVNNPAIPIVKNVKEDHLTIMLGGDIMMDRGIRMLGEHNGYDSLFDDSIKDLFKKADVVVANLEGPITANPSKTFLGGKTTDSFTFTSPPVTAETLKSIGITIVSLANNHIDNFGRSGFTDTQQYLRTAGIEWFGNPWNNASTSPIATIVERNNIKVALVGYHAFQLGVDRVVSEIRRVSGPDVFTIVMPHWGEEYVTIPSDKMRSYAHAFIAAGADAVIGAHPHVVAEQEWVGAVPVYYSLGNLLFDQYFSEKVKHGMIVELDLVRDEDGISIDHVTTHDTVLKPGVGVSLAK